MLVHPLGIFVSRELKDIHAPLPNSAVRCSRFFLAQSAPTHGVIFQQRGENWLRSAPSKLQKSISDPYTWGQSKRCADFLGMRTSRP